MDRKQALQEVRQQIKCTDYLEKSKSGLYCCPFCDSGHGPKGTGALKYHPDTNTWYCNACHKYGDVIDLYQNERNIDFNTALSLLAEEIGIEIGQNETPRKKTTSPAAVNTTEPQQNREGAVQKLNDTAPAEINPNEAPVPVAEPADYMAYYYECRNRLKDPAAAAYLQARGISYETAAAHFIGYDPEADPANAPGAEEHEPKTYPAPRIIIPTTRAHYVGRSIEPNTPEKYKKMNPKDSTPGLFNGAVLYAQDVQEVFVFEGAFDALSSLEAGYPAIALNSAGNYKTLIKQLEKRRTDATLILCPDNDPNPKTAERVKKDFDELAAGLQRLNIAHITADVNCRHKDANEALVANKNAFIEALEQAKRFASAKPDNTQYYIDRLMTGEIERFKDDKKTGFRNLDAQAGGLYPGLYTLAAVSSLGKTSFALQLADQLAEAGNDILFFSLEMSRLELVSKSIARRTVTRSAAGNLQFGNAVTSLEIRKGIVAQQVQDAARDYKKAVADRISIVEGNFNCNISFIGDYVRQYVQRNNVRPVVFIDYLQILQPADDVRKATTKEVIDISVTELKRLSRELNLTIVVISSINRTNYLTPIDFESLKESGSIEYSCDVVWGLQLQCMNDELFDKDSKIKEKRETVRKAKAAMPRKIELTCLKNRYGISNYSCYFEYYPANDLFVEDEDSQTGSAWKSGEWPVEQKPKRL